ncbi:TVP38/TMEM64 family protein [Salinicoccus albus]|uniref:TVP38/TMEM64 family protein n=1 Tax=Salinicoccus albus TaxID=418756 RepID=UPI000371FC7F|nr:VTT domain-containing protein [Salinicoccus albus]
MSSGEERTNLFSWRSIGSLIILLVLGTSLLWVSFNLDLPAPAEMREIILSYGWAGWLVFFGITAAIAITPIPIVVPALVAGSLYGLIGGTLLSFLGVMLGSWIGYWLARALGQRFIFHLLGQHSSIVQNYLTNAGFWAMCTVRLMPGLPYWPVNYGAGALGVGQYAFISATFLSSIPGQVSLVALGAFAVNPSVFHVAVLIISWVAVLTLTWVSYRYWRGTNPDTQDAEATEK